MKIHTGQSFFKELKKLITNIPEHTISLDIHTAVDEVVTMHVKAAACTANGQPVVEGDKVATQDMRFMVVPEGAAFDADYELVGYQYRHRSGWRDEQRWNGHTSMESRAIYARKPLPPRELSYEEKQIVKDYETSIGVDRGAVDVTTLDSEFKQYVKAQPGIIVLTPEIIAAKKKLELQATDLPNWARQLLDYVARLERAGFGGSAAPVPVEDSNKHAERAPPYDVYDVLHEYDKIVGRYIVRDEADFVMRVSDYRLLRTAFIISSANPTTLGSKWKLRD